MIKSIKAKTILDSRKRPTVQVELRTENGVFEASCPSGASTGKYEAKIVSAKNAVNNVKIINKLLVGQDETKQKRIDNILMKKKAFGANAILPVSIACCRAGAASKNLPLYKYISKIFRGRASITLPRPCFNIINGGAHVYHAGRRANNLDIQEFMIVPDYFSFAKNLEIGKKVFNNLKKLLQKDFGKKGIIMGDEGGFAPPISDPEKALDYIIKAIRGLKVDPAPLFKKEIKKNLMHKKWCGVNIGLDVAATQLKKKYDIDFYKSLLKKYPIIFIEDPFAETDDKGFSSAVKNLKTIIVGDDYLTTNIKRIKRAKNNCTGIIIKPNQIGTIAQTLQAVKLAKSFGWKTIVSHRSGETMDDFIADLAAAVGSEFIKSGAPSKPERLSKYKRLAKIEREI